MLERDGFLPKHVAPFAIVGLIAGLGIFGVALATGMLNFGPLVNPGGPSPPEKLVLLNYTISYDQNQQNPTLLILWLENDEIANSSLSSINIQDLSSSTNSATTPPLNGTVGPGGGTAKVTVDTLGSGFYFVHGHSYKFTIKTLRQNQFSFSVNYP